MSYVFFKRQLQTILDLNVNTCRFSSTTYEMSEKNFLFLSINVMVKLIQNYFIHNRCKLFFSNKNSKK